LDRIEVINQTPEYAEWNVRVRKVNKTRSLVGSIVFRQPISNENSAEFKVLKKQGMQLLRID
jgi:hypothetical protein